MFWQWCTFGRLTPENGTIRYNSYSFDLSKQFCTDKCDSAIPWPAAHQAPLSMGFSRQGYWSGLPIPSPGDLPDPGIKPGSPALQADSLLTELPGKLATDRYYSHSVYPMMVPFFGFLTSNILPSMAIHSFCLRFNWNKHLCKKIFGIKLEIPDVFWKNQNIWHQGYIPVTTCSYSVWR